MEQGFSGMSLSTVQSAIAFFIFLFGGMPQTLASSPERPFLQLTVVQDASLVELSGVAASRRWPGVYWGHNDSGSSATLFAFNRRGQILARIPVTGAEAIDWEDLALFEHGGRSWLMIGDIGDNFAWRASFSLYLLPEPALDADSVAVVRRINVRYEDGPRDAESLAVDVQGQRILILEKAREQAGLYAVPLDSPVEEAVTARRLASLQLAAGWRAPGLPSRHVATAMDLSPDGRWLGVLSYRHFYAWHRKPAEPWSAVLERRPQRWALPRHGGFEAVAIEADSRSVVIAPEGQPMPLFRARGLLNSRRSSAD